MVNRCVTKRVNVVPGDEAANRIPDPTVRTVVLFHEAQDIKRRAQEAFLGDDRETGRRLLQETTEKLDNARKSAPAAMAGDIEAEIEKVRQMTGDSFRRTSTYMSKMTSASYHDSNRKSRGKTEE